LPGRISFSEREASRWDKPPGNIKRGIEGPLFSALPVPLGEAGGSLDQLPARAGITLGRLSGDTGKSAIPDYRRAVMIELITLAKRNSILPDRGFCTATAPSGQDSWQQ